MAFKSTDYKLTKDLKLYKSTRSFRGVKRGGWLALAARSAAPSTTGRNCSLDWLVSPGALLSSLPVSFFSMFVGMEVVP